VADVLSHIGSGAVIWLRQLEDTLAGQATPEDFAPSVWAEWDAKAPHVKADDALVADEGLLERLERLSEDDRADLAVPMGPLRFSFGEAVAMRLNEHALHTWDVEVAFDDGAHLPADAAAVVVDNLGLIARFTGRPPAPGRRLSVRTTHPVRDFTLQLGPRESSSSRAPAPPIRSSSSRLRPSAGSSTGASARTNARRSSASPTCWSYCGRSSPGLRRGRGRVRCASAPAKPGALGPLSDAPARTGRATRTASRGAS